MDFNLLILIAILVLFLLPSIILGQKQRKRQKEIQEFQESLSPGKAVITAGGLHGTVVNVIDSTITLELAPNTVVTVEKSSVIRSQG